jgi:hypothetical protein
MSAPTAPQSRDKNCGAGIVAEKLRRREIFRRRRNSGAAEIPAPCKIQRMVRLSGLTGARFLLLLKKSEWKCNHRRENLLPWLREFSREASQDQNF